MNFIYSDLWKLNERQHPKICCSGQQEKPFNRRRTTEDTIPFIDNLMKDADLESVSEIKLQ